MTCESTDACMLRCGLSDHPRARVLSIDTSKAQKLPGAVRVITADDIPGERIVGLLTKGLACDSGDWRNHTLYR